MILNFKLIILCIRVFAGLFACLPSSSQGQKRASDSMEVELEGAVGHHVVLGGKGGAASALNYSSPQP